MISHKKSIIVTAFAVVALGGVGGGAAWHEHQQQHAKPVAHSQQSQTISYQGVTGKTALDLLRQQHRVVTKTYKDFGDMVTSIDGRTADSKHFWSFYVNNHQSQVGAGSYQTKSGDHLTWKLEALQ
jgi:Domain of unknown function (DUF4430)